MTATIKRILVPVNGTPASERAFRWACQLAKNTKSELHAVYVSEVPLEFPLSTEFVSEDTRGEQVLARTEAIAAEEKCRVHAQLLQGRHAGPAIAVEAEDREMEMIVLGIPFRHRVGSSVLGSTASYLLEHATCQVVLWRERVQAAALAKV
jgi:nucleotide-binding universal stress UspA family protein